MMASQGVRNAGYFYDTHHSLSKKNGGAWDALCFNSEKSPFVTLDWLKERELESGGRNSVEYQIRVLGRFVEDSSNYLLTRADLERGFEPRSIIGKDEPYGYLILCDVGMGEYRDDTVIVVARVIGDGDSGDPMPRRVEFVEVPLCSNDRGINDLPGDLREILEKTSNATLLVDAGGMGASVVKTLESHGVPVKRVIWGSPCFKKRLKERFFNQRACAMVRLRDALRSGRVVFPQGLSNRIKQKIIDQGARLPFHWSESGGLRYVMESKKEMAKQGIKSPDIIDAMSFAFLETATYMMADERLSNETTIGNKALDFAREAFADF